MKCTEKIHHKSTNYHSAFDAECGGEMREVGNTGETSKIDDFGNKIFYKIKLYQCESCKTIQLQ